ncbi:MAG: two-component regulator propeller domain-containing protein [Rikenellaceae bacterium]
MKTLYTLFLYLLLAIISTHAKSLDIQIKSINNSQNLLSEEIRRIHQDSEGFIWFGTPKGLFRYDGYEFTQYSINDNLTNNDITSIDDDSTSVWIGARMGLHRYDKKSRKITVVDSLLAKRRILKVACHNNELWVGTQRCLYKYELTNKQICKYDIGGKVNDILVSSNGSIWVTASECMGLLRYSEQEDKFVAYPDLFSNTNPHVIFQDSKDNLWVGSYGDGVVMLSNYDMDPSKIEKKCFVDDDATGSISGDLIYSIAEHTESGAIWIGHHRGLSILKHPDENDYFENVAFDGSANGLLNNSVSVTYCDRSGDIWVGTMGGGVSKTSSSNNLFTHNPLINIAEKFNSRYITATYKDKYGRIWLGIRDYGVLIYDPETNTYVDIIKEPWMKRIFANNRVLAIFDIGDNIYIGTSGQGIFLTTLRAPHQTADFVYRFKIDGAWTLSKFTNNSHRDVYGNTWVGYANGVMVLNSKGQYIHHQDVDSEVVSLSSDSDGYVYAGTEFSGIYRMSIEKGRVKHKQYLQNRDGLSSNFISTVFVDSQQRVWCSTMNQELFILKRDSQRFICQNDQYNLHVGQICNIFEDSEGLIWAQGSNMLIQLHGNTYNKFLLVSDFTTNLLNEDCNVLRYDESKFIIGGYNGYTTIDTQNVPKQSSAAPLKVTDVEVNYKSIYDNPPRGGVNYRDSILLLSRDNNNITVKFAQLQYKDANAIEYAYRLDGYDHNWHYVTSDQRQASFTNLPKGRFTLQIKSTDETGQWLDSVTELHIRIFASPFGTGWAYLVYLIITITVGSIIWNMIRNRINLQRRLRFATFRSSQNKIMAQTKLQFFTNISHELLTPLTIIGCAVEQISQNQSSRSHIEEYFGVIQDNVTRLRRLIRQVLEFSKAENNKLKLQVSSCEVDKFVRGICENSFRLLAEQKSIDFTIESSPEGVVGWIDTDKLDKILYNLLTNAFKYNYENSYVYVNLSQHQVEGGQRMLSIVIKDGGIGIAPNKLKNIFGRFYDGMYRQTKSEGSGIGLYLTKTLVELHNGRIEVESTLGSGSKFTILLPLDESAYGVDELAPQQVMVEESFILTNENLSNQPYDETKSLLVVEDNRDLRELIVAILSKYYKIFSAADGYAALEVLKRYNIDMIVSDIMMPRMDGIELCRAVKSNIEYSNIPIILLTAKEGEQNKVQGYESGADAYIVKPFSSKLLLSRIQNIFSARRFIIDSIKRDDGFMSIELSGITTTPLDEKLLTMAIEAIEQNIDNEEFNIHDFADAMNVSKSTLYRKIKYLTGMTTTDFVKDVRLRHAARLLKSERQLTTQELASRVGFGQPKYFAVCFRKKYGVMPSKYCESKREVDV